MREYALMQGGLVVNIVSSFRTLEALKGIYSNFEVRLVTDVPHGILVKYRYWNERP